jgi:glucan biosynthesis protein C
MSKRDDNRRFHSLDQLRAVMMLLGLVIHSAVSFTAKPIGAAWPYQDANTHVFFDHLTFFIHIFRMPLFFLMAGFFLGFLYHRRGLRAAVRNRTARLVVPFALFLPLLFLLVQSGFDFANEGGIRGGFAIAATYFATPSVWFNGFDTMHLWFLYYLILFCLAFLFLVPTVQRILGVRFDALARSLGRLIHHPLGFLLCCVTTFVTLLPMSYAGLDTEVQFLVEPRILIAYGVFVVFGWLLYLNRDRVDAFANRAWPFTIAGLLLSSAYLYHKTVLDPAYLLPAKLLVTVAMWTLIYGFLGLFVRYYDRPHPVGRYLSDASYWLYLIHLPITIWVPGLMNGWDVSAFVKSAITLGAAAAVTTVTYHYLVRSTAIGVLLNGKRYPRALPHFNADGSLVQPATPVRRPQPE